MDEKTPIAAPVNWEAVRALAMVVGVREAARRMGIKESAAQQRSAREGWLSSPEARRANQMAIAQRSGLTVAPCNQLSPAALISAELAALGSESRVSIARTVAKAGKHFETMAAPDVIAEAGNLKSIAQTADLVHGWKDAAPQVKIRLDVLNGSTEAPIADAQEVESEVISDWPDGDPVEGY